LAGKKDPKMTYNVLNGTLNFSIPASRFHLRSVPVNLPAPFEDTYSTAVTTLSDSAVLTLTIVVLVVALL